MKRLVIITGPAGIGKTSLAGHLFENTPASAWLDGDWCWRINPWISKSEKEKDYALTSMTRILRGYLEKEEITTVIFSWILPTRQVYDELLKDLPLDHTKVYLIPLIASTTCHEKRMRRDGRRKSQLEERVDMEAFKKLSQDWIDSSNKGLDLLKKEVEEKLYE